MQEDSKSQEVPPIVENAVSHLFLCVLVLPMGFLSFTFVKMSMTSFEITVKSFIFLECLLIGTIVVILLLSTIRALFLKSAVFVKNENICRPPQNKLLEMATKSITVSIPVFLFVLLFIGILFFGVAGGGIEKMVINIAGGVVNK
jgi:hypothetical protein